MLIDKNQYRKTLADLWSKVFGDGYDYIELIFKEEYDKSILCFAAFDSETAVSAFYLLKCTLKLNGKSYNGCYLYAAATLKEHRKNGLMSSLINEAKEYCRNSGLDFICLVPSSEGLYSYYERFSFKKAMYRYNLNGIYISANKDKEISADDYYALRLSVNGDYINFDKFTFCYAAECLMKAGYRFYENCDGSFYIHNSDEKETTELLPESEIHGSVEKIPFGMLCPLVDELDLYFKYTDIYMNIALD